MRKKVNKKIIILVLVLVVAVGALGFGVTAAVLGFSLDGEAAKLEFAVEKASVYLSEGKTYTPEVKIWPKMAEYTLSSSNDTIAKAEGTSITLVRAPGIVTITATSGELTDTMTLMIFKEKFEESKTSGVESEFYTVVFLTAFGQVADQQVAPGEVAAEPEIEDFIAGQMFEGWYLKDGNGERYDFSTPVTGNIILLANWLPVAEATYNYGLYNGGVYITSIYYTYIKYQELNLPETVPEGTLTKNNVDISGRAISGVYEGAFKGNTSVEKVTIPASYVRIWKEAFMSCSALKEVKFPGEGMLEINEYAFAYCTALESCVLPDSITELGEAVFRGDVKLADIGNIPSGLSTLNKYLFAETAIASVNISGVDELASRVFENCANLETVTGIDGVKKFGTSNFNGTKYIENALAASADGAVYVGTTLLYYSPKTSVYTINVLPTTTYIAGGALYGNVSRDTTFVFATATVPERGLYAIDTGNEHLELVVPEESYKDYLTAWKLNANNLYFEKTIDGLTLRVRNTYSEDALVSREVSVMKYRGDAEEVNLKTILDGLYKTASVSYSVEKINTSAFYGYDGSVKNSVYYNLKRIILPTSTKLIERNAISFLKNLQYIEFVGDAEDFTSLTLETTGINVGSMGNTTWKIYVPSALQSSYSSIFVGSYASKLEARSAK